MQVHKVIDYATLEVVLDLVDDDLLTNVDQFHVCKIALVLVDGLIDLLVVSNAVSEIRCGGFWVLSYVVRRRSLDLEDVAHDQVLIVAFRLDEQGLNVLSLAALLYPPTTALRRVGRIEDRDQTSAFRKPLAHVVHSGFGGSFSQTFTLGVRLVEKLGGGVWGCGSTILPHVEGFRFDR